MQNVWTEIDALKRKSDTEQNEAKKTIESLPGWKFKGWNTSAKHGVVWCAINTRAGSILRRATISELVEAVRAKQADIEAKAKQ